MQVHPRSSASAAPPSQLTLKLTVHTLAALLSLQPTPSSGAGKGHHGGSSPLFEFAATALSADVLDVEGGCLGGTARAHLQLSAFNGSKLGWEPVLEPWRCK